MPAPTLLWIWICAWLSCAGWALSAAHELNAAGYSAALLAGGGLLWWRSRQAGAGVPARRRWPGLRRRFSRAFPRAFLILAGMALLGGALYAPDNYDALAYRVPRVLHWLAEGRWHWIHTVFPRVNTRGCGIEWLSAPLIALTGSDRLLFLINIVSFLLLPGLIFSVFTRLGVRPRAAWHWMWVVPSGYCFLLQAGSIGNDLFCTPLALAAVDFALRARTSRALGDVLASVLAAALMTSAKASCLPLLLPWALSLLPSWRLLLQAPGKTVAVGMVAIAVSFLPNAGFNLHYLHDWSGNQTETTGAKNDPGLRAAANLALTGLHNLTPPVFPLAGQWDRLVHEHMPAGLNARLHETMVEPEAAEFKLDEMQLEENAGLGLGVSLLVIISVGAVMLRGGGRFLGPTPGGGAWLVAVRVSPWVSLLVLLSQSAIAGISRILTPYYPLILMALLLAPGHAGLVKRGWWRAWCLVVFLAAGMTLWISPARPLFPALTLLRAAPGRSPALARALTVYTVYRDRPEAFQPVLAQLPPEVKVLGLFTYDDPEAALWRPYGSRRIVHICPQDTRADLEREGVRYLLVPPQRLSGWFKREPAEWVRGLDAEVIQVIPLKLRASEEPESWWLVRLH